MFIIFNKYKKNTMFYDELTKTNHRAFTTAFNLGKNPDTINLQDSQSAGSKQFAAIVTDCVDDVVTVEMRNRFRRGDVLEILSPSENFNKTFTVGKMIDENGDIVEDAKMVLQKLKLEIGLNLSAGDILRK